MEERGEEELGGGRGRDAPVRRGRSFEETLPKPLNTTRRVGNPYGSRDLPLDGKIHHAPGL